MDEHAFFLGPEGARRFGVFHQPAARPAAAMVFCHPFGEEKLWTHRVFVTFARELAGRGVAVLRLDYRGNGDSDGAFEESSVETALADINAAVEWLQQETRGAQVGLLGLRLGATLACRVAEDRSDISRLVLWGPIVDGGRYMQELLRINLTTQMAVYKSIRMDREAMVEHMRDGGTVNVDGYDVTWPMFEQMSRLSLAGPKRFEGRCLLVHIDRRPEAPPTKELTELAASYRSAQLAVVQEEPFWKEITQFYDRAPRLFTTTLEWVDRP